MRTLRRVVAAHLVLTGVALGQPDSREQEMQEAAERITPVREKADTLLIEGRPDEANALILAIYPATGRTPVQSLMLGNVLFKQNPAQEGRGMALAGLIISIVGLLVGVVIVVVYGLMSSMPDLMHRLQNL